MLAPLFEFQPTRPLRGATRSRRHGSHYVSISTHAPLAGRDVNELTHPSNHRCISTHAPLAGRDEELTDQGKQRCEFQPTRPLRGATSPSLTSGKREADFNPRAPCGARLSVAIPNFTKIGISTHAPLAGRDSKSVQITMHIFAITDKFQMLLHRMPPVRAFCSFLMQENHADFGCEPPK